MQLKELFDRRSDWYWSKNLEDYKTATFPVGDKIYDVTFEEDREGEWWVEFGLKKEGAHKKKFDVTGSGDELLVFTTVLGVIEEFIQRLKPTELSFNAAEPSRQKLYKRMVQRLGGGWHVETKQTGEGLQFTMSRNIPNQ